MVNQKEKLTKIVSDTRIFTYEGYNVVGEYRLSIAAVDAVVSNLLDQGVVVPPCKVGDRVYFPATGRSGVVTSFYYCDNPSAGNLWISVDQDKRRGYSSRRVNISVSDFGKTVVLEGRDDC